MVAQAEAALGWLHSPAPSGTRKGPEHKYVDIQPTCPSSRSTHAPQTHPVVSPEAHRYAHHGTPCWQDRLRLEVHTGLGIKLRELGRKVQGPCPEATTGNGACVGF